MPLVILIFEYGVLTLQAILIFLPSDLLTLQVILIFLPSDLLTLQVILICPCGVIVVQAILISPIAFVVDLLVLILPSGMAFRNEMTSQSARSGRTYQRFVSPLVVLQLLRRQVEIHSAKVAHNCSVL
jgi:hypothetical protein